MLSQNKERRTTVESGVQDKNINIDDNSSFKSTRDIDSLRPSHKESEAEDKSIHAQAVLLLNTIKETQMLRLRAEAIRKEREEVVAKTKVIQDALIYLVGNPAYLLRFSKWRLYAQLKHYVNPEIEPSSVCLFYHS